MRRLLYVIIIIVHVFQAFGNDARFYHDCLLQN